MHTLTPTALDRVVVTVLKSGCTILARTVLLIVGQCYKLRLLSLFEAVYSNVLTRAVL